MVKDLYSENYDTLMKENEDDMNRWNYMLFSWIGRIYIIKNDYTSQGWRRKWQPTPVFLPGESQGWGILVAAVYGVTQSQTRLKWLSSSSSSQGNVQIQCNSYQNTNGIFLRARTNNSNFVYGSTKDCK